VIKASKNNGYGRSYKALMLGTIFLKYGARGQPKQRHVYLQDNGKRLSWKDPGATKASNWITVKDIIRITNGRETKKFKRFKAVSQH
jgi:nitrous oxide reductase accessory protein NosL